MKGLPNFLRLLCIITLLFLNSKVKSQCTQVCGTVTAKGTITTTPGGTQSVTPVAGSTFTVQQKAGTTFTTQISGTPTVAITGTPTVVGTLTVTPTGNYTVATTYSYVTVAGANSISAGALSVSVSNAGDATALFNTISLPAGASVNIIIPNAVLPSYTYDCQTSKLIVLVNR